MVNPSGPFTDQGEISVDDITIESNGLTLALHDITHRQVQHSGLPLQPPHIIQTLYEQMAEKGETPDRVSFFAEAAAAMRGLLTSSQNMTWHLRGDDPIVMPLETLSEKLTSAEPPTLAMNVAELDGAMNRLEHLDPSLSRLVELRLFAGLSKLEIANLLGTSERRVTHDWRAAKVWLCAGLENPYRPHRHDHWERSLKLFRAALEQPADQRTAFLDNQCRHNPSLRQEVDNLFRAMDAAKAEDRTEAPPAKKSGPDGPSPKRKTWVWIALLALLAVIIYWF